MPNFRIETARRLRTIFRQMIRAFGGFLGLVEEDRCWGVIGTNTRCTHLDVDPSFAPLWMYLFHELNAVVNPITLRGNDDDPQWWRCFRLAQGDGTEWEELSSGYDSDSDDDSAIPILII